MSDLKQQYREKIVSALQQELKIGNRLAVPRVQKVTVNVGVGKLAKTNPKLAEEITANLAAITGQKPAVRRARQAISGFKVRAGEEVGLTVTLRGQKMYDFLAKLANIALPRLRDFRGLNPKSFDKSGNLTLGIKEQIIFPEIVHEKAEQLHGLEVSIVTNSGSAENSQKLLEKLGFPFKKEKHG